MPELYNLQTNKIEKLPEDQIQNAIAAGTHSYGANDMLNIKDTDTGEWGHVPGDQLPKYLASGKYHLETPTEKATNDYIDENQGLKGDAKVFIAKGLNQLALGLPDIAAQYNLDPFDLKRLDALAEDHSVASTLGNVAGFTGSLFVGGPLWKAAGKGGDIAARLVANQLSKAGIERGAEGIARNLTAKVATNIAKYGTEGVVISAPAAITEVSLGDPQAAAESLLYGGMFGSLLGSAGAVAPEIIGAAKKLMPYQSAEEMVNVEAAKILGFQKGTLKKAMQKYGEDAPNKIADTILNAKIEDEAGKLKNVFNYTDTTKGLLNNVDELISQSGSKLDAIRSKVDNTGERVFDVNNVVNKVDDTFGKKFDTMAESAKADPLFGKEYQEYEGFKNYLANLAPEGTEGYLGAIDLKTAAQARSLIWDKYESTKNPMYKYAYGLFKGEEDRSINYAINKMASKTETTGLLQDYKKAANDYWAGLQAKQTLINKIAAHEGNRMFGPMEAGAGIIGGVAGGGLGALAGIVGKKLLDKYGHKAAVAAGRDGVYIARKAMQKVAEAANNLGSHISTGVKERVGAAANTASGLSVFNRIFGSNVNKTDKDNVKQIMNNISELQQNGLTDPHLEAVTTFLGENGAPETAQAINMYMGNMINYLADKMPKQPQENPFRQDEWTPSDTQVSAFKRVLHAAENPLSLIDDIKDGTLTKDKVECVKSLYPKIYAKLVDTVHNTIIDGKGRNLPYNTRVKLGMLLGTPIESSIKHLPSYQNTYQTLQGNMSSGQIAQQQRIQRNKLDIQPMSYASESQRLQSRV